MLHNSESDSSLVADVQKFLSALKLTKEQGDEVELATSEQDSGTTALGNNNVLAD